MVSGVGESGRQWACHHLEHRSHWKRGGASELFPCALAAAVAWVAGVVCVKFWVVNPWEDV